MSDYMAWWRSLSPNQKINLKDLYWSLTGFDWSTLNIMFSLGEKIKLMYNKLVMEGIIKEKQDD